MSNEQEAWSIAWRMVTNVNELTEEIVQLKEQQRNQKNTNNQLVHENEQLKMLYYKTLADFHQEKAKQRKPMFQWLLGK